MCVDPLCAVAMSCHEQVPTPTPRTLPATHLSLWLDFDQAERVCPQS